jgi:hypothetical protein
MKLLLVAVAVAALVVIGGAASPAKADAPCGPHATMINWPFNTQCIPDYDQDGFADPGGPTYTKQVQSLGITIDNCPTVYDLTNQCGGGAGSGDSTQVTLGVSDSWTFEVCDGDPAMMRHANCTSGSGSGPANTLNTGAALGATVGAAAGVAGWAHVDYVHTARTAVGAIFGGIWKPPGTVAYRLHDQVKYSWQSGVVTVLNHWGNWSDVSGWVPLQMSGVEETVEGYGGANGISHGSWTNDVYGTATSGVICIPLPFIHVCSTDRIHLQLTVYPGGVIAGKGGDS